MSFYISSYTKWVYSRLYAYTMATNYSVYAANVRRYIILSGWYVFKAARNYAHTIDAECASDRNLCRRSVHLLNFVSMKNVCCLGACGLGATFEVVIHFPVFFCPRWYMGKPFIRCPLRLRNEEFWRINAEAKPAYTITACNCIGSFSSHYISRKITFGILSGICSCVDGYTGCEPIPCKKQKTWTLKLNSFDI